VAREFFRAEHGRDPIDAREIAATIAKLSRSRTQTVAGYDLTFSPVSPCRRCGRSQSRTSQHRLSGRIKLPCKMR
jgi:hypothetical protein